MKPATTHDLPPAADRIAIAFARCRARGEAALVTYVMAGDPDVATSKAMAVACVEGGADLVELGIPFSDPIADGPTIQHAAERALAAGATTRDVLAVAAHLRSRSDVPIALMGYLNPILAHGVDRFAKDCERAGVDALELSTADDLVDALLRFSDLRKRRSQLAAGGGMPQHLSASAGGPAEDVR